MADLRTITTYLDGYLRVAEIGDYPDALNGLQVENDGSVTRVAGAVDASAATIRLAAEAGVDLLVVHHGLFWGWPRPIVGGTYARVSGLVRRNVALYSAHLPLDLHPDVGNNAELARMLRVDVRGPFGASHGHEIGVWGERRVARDALAAELAKALGTAPKVMPFGPPESHRIGIVTGAAGSMIREAAARGLDTFITGEGAHHSYFDAEELGVNVFFGGHYATETVGVRALARHVGERFGVPWTFIDHPTGL